MKKGIIFGCSVLIAALLAIGIVALVFSGTLSTGVSPDGNFPSDVAIANGFNGTAAEWLAEQQTASTHERKLYEEAVADGYEGSYLDFLKELGTGAYDDSAYVNSALRSVVSIQSGFSSSYMLGAGVIYSLDTSNGDAYIVTNYHVVAKANTGGRVTISDDISVFLYGGETDSGEIGATYFGGSMMYDIAVLKVTGSSLLKETQTNAVYAVAATVTDSDSITVGERVYAIGNPAGYGISVTAGVVSVDAEHIDITAADESTTINLLEIRTDAAVNHGNSGGGLFNAAGELIGIVNARSEEDGVEAFGYAIPANLAIPLAQNIIDNATVISKSPLCARLGITLSVSDSRGVYDEQSGKYYIEEKVVVADVEALGAGSIGGIKKSDTLVSATLIGQDGVTRTVAITRVHKLSNLLMNARLGDTLQLTLSRNGETMEVTIELNKISYFAAKT